MGDSRIHGWTDERVETAKRLWTVEGRSAAEIAKVLGGGLSRMAVIGKIHRLGLASIGRGAATMAAAAKSRLKAPPVARNARVNSSVTLGIDRTAPALEFAPLPASDEAAGTATILTIKGHQCKWPIGDPQADDFSLCGKFKTRSGPYCEAHARRAHVTTTKRNGALAATELARSVRRYT